MQMKKLLIIITCIASLGLAGCSSSGLRLVHKIDVQQGNVLTQDEINQLEPGMTRRQVQFIMGSPMVADVFHQERWDYIYRFKPGYGEITEERVSVFFDGDSLERLEGSMHPAPEGKNAPSRPKQVTLVVPPHERIERGVFNKLWHWLTLRKKNEDSI
ncbi:MAG: outer membrane protein assembly factor BamE [Gammaproteobacteria bacterium]